MPFLCFLSSSDFSVHSFVIKAGYQSEQDSKVERFVEQILNPGSWISGRKANADLPAGFLYLQVLQGKARKVHHTTGESSTVSNLKGSIHSTEGQSQRQTKVEIKGFFLR